MTARFPKRFFEESNIEVRMIQSWLVLVSRAHNHQTITYAELTRLMRGKTAPPIVREGQWKGLRLGQLYTYCAERGLPILPVIVVTKETGLPADMAPYYPNERNGPEPNAEREKVFNYDWFALHPPCEGDLHG
jgi:hypothetical protein